MSEALKPCPIEMVEIYGGKDDQWKGWHNLVTTDRFRIPIAGPINPRESAPLLEVIAAWSARHIPEGYALVRLEDLDRAAEWFTESQGWNWLEYDEKPIDIDEMQRCVDELKKFKAVIAAAQEGRDG